MLPRQSKGLAQRRKARKDEEFFHLWGLRVERQVAVSIEYNGKRFDEGFRADLIVEGKVIVELKSVENVNMAHKKQLLTYLRLTGMKLGYLLNFGEALLKDGITRTINGPLKPAPDVAVTL